MNEEKDVDAPNDEGSASSHCYAAVIGAAWELDQAVGGVELARMPKEVARLIVNLKARFQRANDDSKKADGMDGLLNDIGFLLGAYDATILRSADDTGTLVVSKQNVDGTCVEEAFNSDIDISSIEHGWHETLPPCV